MSISSLYDPKYVIQVISIMVIKVYIDIPFELRNSDLTKFFMYSKENKTTVIYNVAIYNDVMMLSTYSVPGNINY